MHETKHTVVRASLYLKRFNLETEPFVKGLVGGAAQGLCIGRGIRRKPLHCEPFRRTVEPDINHIGNGMAVDRK